MPPRRRAAKKAAAKKATSTYTGPSFPLKDGGYLSTSSIPERSQNRGSAVVQVSKALGLGVHPVYSETVRAAVVDFQRERGLEVTGVVDRDVWEALFSAPHAGGVDAAQKPDETAGKLDAPEGTE